MNKAKILLTMVLMSLAVGFVLGRRTSQPITKTVITEKVEDEKINEIRPLDYIVSLETSKGILKIQTTEGYILINPVEGNYNNKSIFKANIVVGKNKYPELFRQGPANASLISAKLTTNKSNGRLNVELSNNQPDHGGYRPTYLLSVDSVSGAIEENLHPGRDMDLSAEDSKYLNGYPKISALVGNSSIWKLEKKQLIVDGLKLESIITIPITSSSCSKLFIFDKSSVYITEKGCDISVKIVGKTIEVRLRPEMIGNGDDSLYVKVYAVDNQTNTLTKIKEYEEE